MVRSGGHDCYLFHVPGRILADLYGTHGEQLLQRNIRIDQRDTATNRSIEASCSGADAANFLHFNNGVSFLCDTAQFDHFSKQITLNKAQVVNGGQTIRALHRALTHGSLQPDTVVVVRAITAMGNKEFASNVAVNQNNQNQMGTGFLRSTDPRIVQLDHALASQGWYFERREGELDNLSDVERAAIENRIRSTLQDRVIRLKEGTQAYVATFFGQPELAKKNAKKMFLSVDDGGSFEKIFSPDLTAEKMIIAHRVKSHIDEFIRQFMTRKRRKDRVPDWQDDYKGILGGELVERFGKDIDQVVPQSAIFICGTIFQDWVRIQGRPALDLPGILDSDGIQMIQDHLLMVLDFAEKNRHIANKSWPSLLKSMAFFNAITALLHGKRGASAAAGSGRSAT